MSSLRVLVVEDFAPFRKVICSTLGGQPSLQIIAEVSDGSEAVRQAVELKPDLILLDIGLPTVNGIAAARQIREVVPDSKVIIVSQESSPDVVQEALNLGARGYVVKTRAASDLMTAVKAVLEGRQFVSVGLLGQNFTYVPTASCSCAVADSAIPSLSARNSVSDVVNTEEPQSKQTKTFGNAKTPGLARCLIRLKWIIISAVTSA